MSLSETPAKQNKVRIGIDLGGTKIEFVALERDGRELHRHRVPTPRGDYDGTVRAIKEGVERIERELQRSATVGVGIPGTISRITHTVKNANSTWMNGKPFDRDLCNALGREVRCANDANCLAVSEATDGAGAGQHLVFAVILGTGCGGGLAVDGRVHNGRNGVLLRYARLHRDVDFRDRAGRGLRARDEDETKRQGNHRAMRRGRSGRGRVRETVRRPVDAQPLATGEHSGP
jgi:hypothetical protein